MRNYTLIGKNISSTGFFSEYLPPCFQLDDNVFRFPPPIQCDAITPYSFTMSRYSGAKARRTIFIPEIGAYLAAQGYMNDNGILKELIEFSERSTVSFSPILGKDDSIVRHEQIYGEPGPEEVAPAPTQYIENIAEKIIRSAGAKQILKLDISNCFSSFYMHMIPAIILGADGAETEYRKWLQGNASETYKKYQKLDVVIRQQNLNRTNGLLPGILSSKIIAEAILTRIDLELEERGLVFSRYVDDYEVYLYRNEAEEVITAFEQTLRRYGFVLNSEKTEIIDYPYYVEENFEKLLDGQLRDGMGVEEWMGLFNTFFSLERNGVKGAVRYLIKTIDARPVSSNCPLLKAYLLSAIANNDRSLTKACSILIAHREELILSENDLATVRKMIQYHLGCEHDLEIIWLLFLLTETGNIQAGDAIVDKVVNSKIELAQLLLFRKNLITAEQTEVLKQKAASWILLYEFYAEEHISEDTFIERLGVQKNLLMYQKFKRNSIHFCLQ